MGNNDRRPKIRFKGFNDDWEQHKVCEIAERYDNLRIPVSANLRVKGSTPYYGANGIQDYVDGFTHDGEYILIAEDGANDIKNYPVNYVNGRIWVNNHAHVLQGKINVTNNKFLGYTMSYANIESVLVGGDRPKLNADVMMNLEIKIPRYNEQVIIGEYFSNIDKLITLHQRKLEKLGNIKKSMLEKMFPKDENKVPEIRFKGFNDDWEQYKLGEISNKVTTKNSSLKYLETFTNSAEYGIISQKDFFENNISKVEKLDRYYVVEPEDFVYNPRISINAPVGPINRNTLDRCGVMSPLYSVFKTHNIDNTYLEYFFKSNYWHSFMFFNGDSGARSDRFSIKDTVFMEMPIPYPNIYEQSKIGVFLKQLDNDITLHQRKLEKLKNIKKACLEKMFV